MTRTRPSGARLALISALVLAACADRFQPGPEEPAPARDAGTARPDAAVVPLDPRAIPKFQDALVIPPAMPPQSVRSDGTARYRIGVRQFSQQVLPRGWPETTVFGYGKVGEWGTFHFPGFTLEARSHQKIEVTWVNQLKTVHGRFLPHLLPVDTTLHWADPAGESHEGHADAEHGGYGGGGHGMDQWGWGGPVPIVTHVHGAHVPWTSDGHPEAWYLPAAIDLPAGLARRGPRFSTLGPVVDGEAVFEYPNDQRAMTLWYHDHTLGLTRLNVYAGLAGFYLLRDDEEDALDLPGPAPAVGDAPGTRYYEIPVAIQDRSFHSDGSLAYPASRAEFGDYDGEYLPGTPVSPVWNPEVFGNAIVVNGRTWPYLDVEPRLYRLRLLNGCNARFLILDLDSPEATLVQIGNEGGLLPGSPLAVEEILLAPGERADVLVDFSKLEVGAEVLMRNLGPDEPFAGTHADEPQAPADPATTGLVMKFRVVPPTGQGRPGRIPPALPAVPPLATDLAPRDVSLHEVAYQPADVPVAAMLGTPHLGPLHWADLATETPVAGSTEIWRLSNLTVDAHPIHLHLVHFQVLDRTRFDQEAFEQALEEHREEVEEGGDPGEAPRPDQFLVGDPMPPEPWERGWKETVLANPGEVTRVIATFDLPGHYVWHCHILEHEDHDMMRPLEVLPAP